MIRLLFWLFKKQFLKLAFNHQCKPKGFDGMAKHFIDSNGMEYYSYNDDLDMPIARGKELQKRIMLLQACISEPNLVKFLDAMELALNSGKKSDLAQIGFLIIEMRKRIGIWVDMDLLFDTVALAYIRSDENPAVWDKTIHEEKVAQFKKDSQGGLYDFFYMAGLTDYIPCAGKSTTEWMEYFEKSELKMMAIQKHLDSYITSRN